MRTALPHQQRPFTSKPRFPSIVRQPEVVGALADGKPLPICLHNAVVRRVGQAASRIEVAEKVGRAIWTQPGLGMTHLAVQVSATPQCFQRSELAGNWYFACAPAFLTTRCQANARREALGLRISVFRRNVMFSTRRLLFGSLLLFPPAAFAQTGNTVFGAGYALPVPINAAPGQILNLFVQGVGATLTQPVIAMRLPLPTVLAGISVQVKPSLYAPIRGRAAACGSSGFYLPQCVRRVWPLYRCNCRSAVRTGSKSALRAVRPAAGSEPISRCFRKRPGRRRD